MSPQPHVSNTRFRQAIKRYFYKDIEPEYTQYIEDLIVNGSIESLDTLKELAESLNNDAHFYETMMQKFADYEDTLEESQLVTSAALNDLEARKQDSLESGVNIKTVNGETLLGAGDVTITTARPFNNSWRTNTTLANFCLDVVSDPSVLIGNFYLGELRCSGLPDGMINGEVRVDVLGESNNNKILLLTVTSTNLEPYHWELTYFNGNMYGWRSWVLESEFEETELGVSTALNDLNSRLTQLNSDIEDSELAISNSLNDLNTRVSSKQGNIEIEVVPNNATQVLAYVDKYYRFDYKVSDLTVLLQTPSNATTLKSVILYFTMDSSITGINFVSLDNVPVAFFDGYQIDPDTTYEVNCLYNGNSWIVAYGIVQLPVTP